MALTDHHISPSKQVNNDVLAATSPGLLFSHCRTHHCFEHLAFFAANKLDPADAMEVVSLH